MEKWILFAIISMLFAGLTSTIAKLGLVGISGELGLAVRTVFVFGFVGIFTWMFVSVDEIKALNKTNLIFLSLSALTTSLSWIFYYKALKLGEVSTISIIDKGSFVVAVILGILIFKEQLTWRLLLGALLISAGLIVVAKK